jgi:hypothetical protein
MSRTIQIIIIFLLADIAVGGLLWYGHTNMQEKKTVEAGLRKDIAGENDKGKKMLALRRSVDLAEPDRVALEQYLFDSSDENLIKFISQMEHLGIAVTGAAVEVRSLDRSGANVHGEFAISGTWSQLYHVLRLVEEIPTHVVVNRFSVQHADISSGAVRGNSDTWSGSLSIDITSLRSGQ